MGPAELEILRNAVTFVPEEMGIALRRTAYSPNIKERMDASCALFDADGRMIAQAEHIPVHLGSMPMTIDVLREEMGRGLAEGDQVIVNDPYRGGSHLPDITLVKPIFYRGGLRGYAVNKAHHADIGGSAPGSMPADSVVLEDEGLVIPPTKFLSRGELRPQVVRAVAQATRNPTERLGDLRAQVAANNLGAARYVALFEKYGAAAIEGFVSEILAYSERRVRVAIASMPRGRWRAGDVLEHPRTGAYLRISAEVTIGGSGIHVSFAGTDPQIEGNLNAPLSVTLSAAYYVFRCLTDPDAPPNAGCYAPVTVEASPGSLVNARSPAAVVAGNVETSSRIVDVLLLAMAPALPARVPAQSQGTMNNLLIGGRWRGRDFSYYETIAGGEGGHPWRDGMDGVHTHMTNTRNTPVEALEMSYPLRVEEYRLIPGSGGRGLHRGGDGVRRTIRFLAPRGIVSIVSDRRKEGPRGIADGTRGRSGRNYLIEAGRQKRLRGKITTKLLRGAEVIIETPGGGGWGPPPSPKHLGVRNPVRYV